MTTQKTLNPNEAAVQIIRVVGNAIKELGSVPSGHLYAQLMCHMSLEHYQTIINLLESADMISIENHYITWKGKK